ESSSATLQTSSPIATQFVVDAEIAGGSDPVAIVCWISGEADISRKAEARRRPLSALARLKPGAVIHTAEGAQVMLVFVDGSRYLLGSASEVRVGRRGVKIDAGSVQRLESVPAVARLPRLAREQKPGKRAAAGRIRHARLPQTSFELYPHDQATLLHDAPVLQFRALARVERYEVEVSDLRGREVYFVEMEVGTPEVVHRTGTRSRRLAGPELDSVRVEIPNGVLEPETVYHLRVSSLAMGRRTLHGDTLFTTASRQHARARHQLARQAASTDDPGLLLLLADFDYRLGLWREACDSLARSAIHQPDQAVWAEVKARFECDEPA
ncbi:MAG: hypothetical protein AAF560_07260, partial [Acidobacteriota bacterium]